MKKLLVLALSFSTFASFQHDLKGYEVDSNKIDKEFNVTLSSGKKESVRFYRGIREEILPFSIEDVKNAALNFKLRCNNSYKDLRILTDKKYDCPYPSKGVVEAFIVKDLKSYQKESNEIERFTVTRRIHRRGDYAHVDLFKVYEIKEDGKRTIYVVMKMLSDDEAKATIKNPIKRESVMLNSGAIFKFKEKAPDKTIFTYDYYSQTDHWLLNKSIAVGEFFDGMSRSFNRLFTSVEKHLTNTKK